MIPLRHLSEVRSESFVCFIKQQHSYLIRMVFESPWVKMNKQRKPPSIFFSFHETLFCQSDLLQLRSEPPQWYQEDPSPSQDVHGWNATCTSGAGLLGCWSVCFVAWLCLFVCLFGWLVGWFVGELVSLLFGLPVWCLVCWLLHFVFTRHG